MPIIASELRCLVDALSRSYDVLGLAAATAGDEVFRQLQPAVPRDRLADVSNGVGMIWDAPRG